MADRKKTILLLSWVVMVVTLLVLVISLNKYGVTGFATDTGSANLTISSQASVAFTDDVCNFQAGSVNETPEVPDEYAYVYSNGTVINGTGWNGCLDGLAIKNDGNTRVTVSVSTEKDGPTFIGNADATFKVLAVPNLCDGTSATNVSYGAFGVICSNWTMASTAQIDFELKIPEDALPTTAGTIITATATAI